MNLSEKAWNKTADFYQTIISHPFNRGLMNGTLDHKIFRFYIEQDQLFLKAFARSLALIAARSENPDHIAQFLKFAGNTIAAEQTIIARYIGKEVKDRSTISLACLSLNSYLLQASSLEPVEVAVASVLPCFWLYLKVGQEVYKQANSNSPYFEWIKNYASEQFALDVETVITIFDELAENASQPVRDKMLEAFYQSSVLEYHFWNDAYELRVYDAICK